MPDAICQLIRNKSSGEMVSILPESLATSFEAEIDVPLLTGDGDDAKWVVD